MKGLLMCSVRFPFPFFTVRPQRL